MHKETAISQALLHHTVTVIVYKVEATVDCRWIGTGTLLYMCKSVDECMSCQNISTVTYQIRRGGHVGATGLLRSSRRDGAVGALHYSSCHVSSAVTALLIAIFKVYLRFYFAFECRNREIMQCTAHACTGELPRASYNQPIHETLSHNQEYNTKRQKAYK